MPVANGDALRIVLLMNRTRGQWSPEDPESWGGGEEAVVRWADAMVAAGHQVTIGYDGPALGWAQSAPQPCWGTREQALQSPHDVVVLRKCPELAAQVPTHVRRVLWTDQPDVPFLVPTVDRIVMPSAFAVRCLTASMPGATDKSGHIPDGYLPELFVSTTRDPFLVMTASSPDRGLPELLDCWGEVIAACPQARLVVAYGWDLFRAFGGDPRLEARVQAQLAALPSVTMGRLSHGEIHALYGRAGVWAYYCTSTEMFCQTGVKAQVGGAVPVVRPWGALQETVPNGLRATTPADFTRALIQVLDPTVQETLRQAMVLPEAAQPWAAVADRWTALLRTVVAQAPDRSGSVMVIPPPPRDLVPPQAPQIDRLITQRVIEWGSQAKPRLVATPDSLPFLRSSYGADQQLVTPETADGVIVGWELEEASEAPEAFLRARLRPGQPFLLFCSYGPWRAAQRHRTLLRADCEELFGALPGFAVTASTLATPEDGLIGISATWDPERCGRRNLDRVLVTRAPRETVALCMIALNAETTIESTLESARPIIDEVCLIDTGSTDRTVERVRAWAARYHLPVRIERGTHPRYCHDCLTEHDLLAWQPGHRMAGFETPRNQSIALAASDWVLWLDADEELIYPERLLKYLRPNMFMGYSLGQNHLSNEPPGCLKTDQPVRMFRRLPHPTDRAGWDGQPWPTFRSGLTVEFCGVVHEHPGILPKVQDGVGPVVIVTECMIDHRGYKSEEVRRRRFLRNWQLMHADRLKYPTRRLGSFLWCRDLTHHVRYLQEKHGGGLPAEYHYIAQAVLDLWRAEFLGKIDMFGVECLEFASLAAQALGRTIAIDLHGEARAPEFPQPFGVHLKGAFQQSSEIVTELVARLKPLEDWDTP